jgi:acyl-coenzyme A thioesterase PaaI-like protein
VSTGREKLVGAARALAASVGHTGVDDRVLAEVADEIAGLLPRLDAVRLPGVPRTAAAEAFGASTYSWQRSNPALPAVEVEFRGGRARAELNDGLNHLYEGPPQHLHGGVAAMLLDVVLSSLVQHHGAHTVTASLTVDFRRPTPLHRPLVITGEIVQEGERKILASGTLVCGGVVTVEAQGVFARLRRELHEAG